MPKNKGKKCLAIILAAGKGSRMKRKNAKAVNPIGGLAMVTHIVNAAQNGGCEEVVVVVGDNKHEIKETLKEKKKITFCQQKNPKGTAHAVETAINAIGAKNVKDMGIVVLNADNPLISSKTIKKSIMELKKVNMMVAGFNAVEPTGYGRIIVKNNEVINIIEEKDTNNEEKKITFCSSGIFAFQGEHINELISKIENDNAQKEYFIGHSIPIAQDKGLSVGFIEIDEDEAVGVNTPAQLAEAEMKWQNNIRKNMMENGVILLAPDTVMFTHDTRIEPNVTIEQNVVFGQGVEIKQGAVIRAFSHLEGAKVEENCIVGPYARLREGTIMQKNAKIGNFVETKKTKIGKGSKVNHLAYIGDAEVGDNVNIGAGSITCNYDGANKHKTKIGNNAFIGTNTALVAPVKIGKNAMTGAGSVITNNVKDGELAIARAEQVNKKKKSKK